MSLLIGFVGNRNKYRIVLLLNSHYADANATVAALVLHCYVLGYISTVQQLLILLLQLLVHLLLMLLII